MIKLTNSYINWHTKLTNALGILCNIFSLIVNESSQRRSMHFPAKIIGWCLNN